MLRSRHIRGFGIVRGRLGMQRREFDLREGDRHDLGVADDAPRIGHQTRRQRRGIDVEGILRLSGRRE